MPSDLDLVLSSMIRLMLFMQVNYCDGKARKRTSNNIINKSIFEGVVWHFKSAFLLFAKL